MVDQNPKDFSANRTLGLYSNFLDAIAVFDAKQIKAYQLTSEPNMEAVFDSLLVVVNAYDTITADQVKQQSARGYDPESIKWILSKPMMEPIIQNIKTILGTLNTDHGVPTKGPIASYQHNIKLFANSEEQELVQDAPAEGEEDYDAWEADAEAAASALEADLEMIIKDAVDGYIAMSETISSKYGVESGEGEAEEAPAEVPAGELVEASSNGKLDKTAEATTVIAPITPNDMYSSYDLSDNVWELKDNKLTINKNLKNLVTKRMNEFLKGAYQEGDMVQVDLGNSITVGTVQAYLGNKTYKVALGGMVATVPEENLFKL